MAYVRRYVPSGIVTEEVLDNIEKAKQPLVKIYHYHTNHLGTPQELSDESGNIIWLSYDRAWGGSFDSLYRQQFVDNWAVSENELQPFKFQGQCLDTETGLHYNRFRYYDSDVGMFISRDPIGLLGGSNVFQYAPNPIGWIDPWGLKCAEVKNETLEIKNKFPAGSKESNELNEFVKKWNEQIKAEGGSMTRQPVSRQTRREANKYAKQEKINNPALYSNGEVAGHITDVGWGGKTNGPFMPLSKSVNSYVGGATQAVSVRTKYTSVVLN